MTRRRVLAALLFLAIGLGPAACTKVYTDGDDRTSVASVNPTAPTPAPTPTPTPTPTPAPRLDKIEFRVIGSNISPVPPVLVRHTDAVNGLTLYAGAVPYFMQFDSTEPTVFLYVEAQGTGNLFASTLQVQIYVNGKLFREGFSQGFTLYTSAAGTYRR